MFIKSEVYYILISRNVTTKNNNFVSFFLRLKDLFLSLEYPPVQKNSNFEKNNFGIHSEQ